MTRKLLIIVEVWDDEYEDFAELSPEDQPMAIADDIIHLNPTILEARWVEEG